MHVLQVRPTPLRYTRYVLGGGPKADCPINTCGRASASGRGSSSTTAAAMDPGRLRTTCAQCDAVLTCKYLRVPLASAQIYTPHGGEMVNIQPTCQLQNARSRTSTLTKSIKAVAWNVTYQAALPSAQNAFHHACSTQNNGQHHDTAAALAHLNSQLRNRTRTATPASCRNSQPSEVPYKQGDNTWVPPHVLQLPPHTLHSLGQCRLQLVAVVSVRC